MSETTSGHIITSVPTQAELMSSPRTPEMEALSTITVSVPKKGLGIEDDFAPFRQAIFHDSVGGEITTNIFASIMTPARSERVMFFGDENKRWLGVVNEDGTVLQGRRLGQDGHVSLQMKDGNNDTIVELRKADKASDGYSWVLRVNQGRGSKVSPQLTLAEGTNCVKNPISHHERKYRTERRKSIVKKLAGAAAVIATFSPGGLIDKTIDPVVDTAGMVHEAGTSMHQHIYTADDHFDGMELKDHPDILAEINEESEAKNAEIDRVANVAAQTMLDLDAHNYGAIQKRADEYVQRNPESFMDPSVTMAMKEHIAAATTNEEVLAALRPLMDFYGKEITINNAHGEIPVTPTRAIATAIVNEIGSYPKSLVDQAELDMIVIDHLNTNEHNPDIRGGDYSSYERRIRINAFSDLAMAAGAMGPAMPVLGELYGASSYEGLLAHEFGHALRGGSYRQETLGDSVSNWTRDILGALADYPEVISGYSRSSTEEKSAEDISGVLSDRADGLTHPDDSRRFVSPANKALLARLIRFGIARDGETAVDPGIIDYLVARNSRLMGRSLVGLGH